MSIPDLAGSTLAGQHRGTTILVVDNFDSFVFTIVGYLEALGATCTVVRNDDIDAQAAAGYDGVLLSPGPGNPQGAGVCADMVERALSTRQPLLGVCLGHQVIIEALGGTISHAEEIMHGRTSEVRHDGTGVFAGVPSPVTVTRYHSLAAVAHTVPRQLQVNATTADGVVMAVRHHSLPLHGVQFHPESILTEHGYLMFSNWLTLCRATTGAALD